MKILHWIPSYNDQLSSGVASQLQYDAVAAYEAGHDRKFMVTHGCVLHQLRNKAAALALDEGFDILCMQDADNYSPMVGGPLMPMIGSMLEADAVACYAIVTLRNMTARANVYPVKVGEVFEVEKAGTGLVVIDLRKIRPWYDLYPGPLFAPICTDAKQHTIDMGMDVFFARLMRGEVPGVKPRLKLIADGRIPTVHVNATARLEYDGRTVPGSPAGATSGTQGEAKLVTPTPERRDNG